ncbi:ExeM/NucH family extracellular endonuclease [Diaminobutyricibacter tongyongensis]|uniref:ExeM/NucH family extracellular endonuclease n=1 Tax=Leifsonia tongyongensis TaxID=1268043 RepID=A0A6L9XXB6_9MICO|nr:ExeM/NucH family extracellular endonuclease [Diaminobutyricibacter tongyongensis]NEN05658.1 ExeM/NucH family extracellular endonuclease [Diaminobutyricibacter tongyongensis]
MSTRFGRLTRAAIAAIAGAGLAAGALVATPAFASTDGTGVVINEAYLSGGSAGAAYTNKFVELYNPGAQAVSLTGWSVQYRPATGTGAATGVVPLSGTIGAKSYFLVGGGSNGTNGVALPTPDVASNLNPSGTTGTLILAKTATALTLPAGSVLDNPNVADLLGYGTSNTFERVKAVAPTGNTDVKSFVRSTFTDTDDNSADFGLSATITPQNTSSVTDPGTGGDPGPPATVSIADIQGTGDVSPKAGSTVSTVGVVTAQYATGGFNGFYLQTPGTGGALDLASHTASDAVFVFGSAFAGTVAPGDYVQVTGAVSEFNGLTEITASAVAKLDASTVAAPAPATVGLPGTAAQRESLEGMLIAPQGAFTVTDVYSANQYGEIALAAGDKPLVQATETARPGTPEYTAALAANAARAVTLDDGASTNFLSAANKSKPLPYLSLTAPVRVGEAVTFTKPVVLDYRNSAWKFQPTAELTPANAPVVQPVTFSNTRTTAPANVGGDLRLATFNVLNYFPTTGDQLSGCTFYTDRDGNNITINTGCDARGAADATSLTRQQDKIVAAINGLTADVVSLEEIENSARFGLNRDDALSTLVAALNTAAGSEVWAYVKSPSALPASEDVIRTAFIYKKANAEPVGESRILDDVAFSNARQPLAQAFKKVGTKDTSAFIAIVNHFKSKGSGTGADADQGDGQGASNASRVNQAHALVAFADERKATLGLDKVLLIGDFNAYLNEDPIKVLTDAGYIDQVTTRTDKYTYSFGGTVGSLDHVLASPAADKAISGADVWNINSVESVALEYSRYNYNVTNLYAADPYRSSDHDPIVVGLGLKAAPVTLNLLNINDFHGRIDSNTVKFAGTIEKLRAAARDANTLFLSDGDNIGASLFASASAGDIPTLDVLNALDLKTSAVGNHEFDKGFSDLTGRVKDASAFSYLGANVYKKGTTDPALPEYAEFTVDGLRVGVIGAVTQETPTLVSPGGISTLDFGDPVAAVNRVAAQLTDGDPSNGEADVLVAEYHEGAGFGTPDGATLEKEVAAGGAFADIVTKTSAKVAAIFTGHTHKQYAWEGPVPGADGATRPIVQTGSYGENIGQVTLTVDPETDVVTAHTARNVARTTDADASLVAAYPRVATVKTIVDKALADSAVIGNQKVGSVTKDITTAYINGARDDRMSESTLGNLVADSLLTTLSPADLGGAEIGVVNPGGLRAELLYGADGSITYAQANAVLPFVNNLWTTTLTGAQFKQALEQQWQRNADGTMPSRPFLNLGLSKNVSYTFDASRAEGDRITSIIVNGQPIDPAKPYRIGSFSFLVQGGDNFRAFAAGTNTKDSGLIDRDAWIAYLQNNSPVSPSFAKRGVSVSGVPTGVLQRGDHVSFTVSKLNLTSLGSPANTSLQLTWAGSSAALGNVAVDATGTATVSFTVPADAAGASTLVLTAPDSGTTVRVALTVADLPANPKPSGDPKAAKQSALTKALGDLVTVDKGTYRPGDDIRITVGASHAGDWVSVWAYSPAKEIGGGWLQVPDDGILKLKLPSTMGNGSTTVSVQNAADQVLGWTTFKVKSK